MQVKNEVGSSSERTLNKDSNRLSKTIFILSPKLFINGKLFHKTNLCNTHLGFQTNRGIKWLEFGFI